VPITLPRIEPVVKKARIVNSLRDAIISGEIRSGEQIVEGKLAQQFGVDQGVIREALIELEPLAFFLAGPAADTQAIAELRELAGKATVASGARNITDFLENHLAFRRNVWTLAGNRYLEQILERLVVPLFALYMIRQFYNIGGILQTTMDCTDHQDRILTAYERKDFADARETAHYFLVRMKDYLGTRLPPASSL
jgi:DNA-binding GntR family transcriptional regulator